MARRFPALPPAALDAGLALVVTALELSDLLVFNSGNNRDALTIALLLLSSVPLVAWRRWPFIAFQLTAWATVALAARHDTHLGLGPIAATYGVASWGGTITRRVTAAALLIAVWLVPLLTDDTHSIPTNAALFSAAWVLGALMRERRVQAAALQARTVELAREREEKAALAAEGERARIARELHDVLTHSVSVMVIQAQAAQTPEPDVARMTTALSRIESIGKETLTELRGLLRQIRPSSESLSRQPQPGLDRIGELVDSVRDAGIDVDLVREGRVRSVPASVGLSAYRIVQEALTNTMRHTASARAHVALRYGPSELAVEVRDDGPGLANAAPAGGRGIAGMRERASAVGGTLVAEPCPEGGFRVAARLPLAPTS
ncbi:MAG: sensor histidine kinase [Solirubrobacteraceae bacterium]